MFVFSMRPCQINSQLVNLLSLVGEDQTHLGRHVVQTVMILLVMVEVGSVVMMYRVVMEMTWPHPISLPLVARCAYHDGYDVQDGDGAVDGDHRPGLTPLACHSLPAEPINPTQLFTLLSCSLLCNQSLLAS